MEKAFQMQLKLMEEREKSSANKKQPEKKILGKSYLGSKQ